MGPVGVITLGRIYLETIEEEERKYCYSP